MARKLPFKKDSPHVANGLPTSSSAALWALVAVLGLIAFFLGAIAVHLILPKPAVNPLESSRSSLSGQAPSPIDPRGESAVSGGNFFFDQKRWREAAEQYEAALGRGIDNPDLRTDLGSAYRFNGDFIKAEENYQVAQRQNPAHENSLYNLGTLYLESLHQPQRAAGFFREYLHRFPEGAAGPKVRELLAQAEGGTAASK